MRVTVPRFNSGAFFFPYFGMSLGESEGKEQEFWWSPVLAGIEFGLVTASGSEAEMSLSSDLVLHQGVESRESERLNIYPLTVIEEPILPVVEAFDWVVHKTKSFRHIVGLPCEEFEEELFALLIVIEASRTQYGPASPSSPLFQVYKWKAS
jgi:hypothetical protein